MARISVVLCICLLGGSRSVSAWFWPFKSEDPAVFTHEHVIKLTKDTFENHVIKEDGRFYFAKFYAPWCGHCKTLAPTWGQVAAENTDPAIDFIQVDCAADRAVCDKAAVRGYPEFKIFYNGRVGLAMRGGKSLEGMRQFVKDALPKVRENHAKAMEEEAKEKEKVTAASGKKQGSSSSAEL